MINIIQKLKNNTHLTFLESKFLFEEIFSGNISEIELEEILVSLSKKGEYFEEIAGAAEIMQFYSLKISHNISDIFDVCGTGGSGNAKTFNLSTTVAFVLAGGGVTVAKHGNRAASSKSGSADVLELLGINLEVTPEQIKEQIEKIGIAFLFAQKLHPAMKFVMPVRKKIGKRTIFNILGPLTNPAGTTRQIMGVYSKDLIKPVIKALKQMGKRSAMVVYGEDGLDEITLTGKTYFARFLEKGEVEYGEITPEQFGFQKVTHEELAGGSPQKNAEILKGLLKGEIKGAKKDLLLLNAGVGFFVAGKTDSIEKGIDLAKEVIESGEAWKKLEVLKKSSLEGQI